MKEQHNYTISIAADHRGYELKELLKQSNKEITWNDLGTTSTQPADYVRYAHKVAQSLNDGIHTVGVLICGSGMGMCIAANRYAHVRAAMCHSVEDAELARKHNDANVLILSARAVDESMANNILKTFLSTKFEGGRHQARVTQLSGGVKCTGAVLANTDADVFNAITKELERQQSTIELIASENIVDEGVLEAQGSVLTNKYAEGYAGKRYYGGCEFVDDVERLAIERLKKLFSADFANVQPHSGSQANQAVFLALLQPGDPILGMSLDAGGHLTHGSRVNMSGKWFEAFSYGVRQEDGLVDMAEVERMALEHKPKLIIAGGSAYPRTLDFAEFRRIADSVGAYLMVDMAHFAGLVAGGVFPSPIPHAHVVTSTTHKTLRGPRGGIILTNDAEIAKKINSAVFPGLQGGPLMHVIAAKAVAFGQALQPSFKAYAKQVVDNAKALAQTLEDRGYHIFSGGTDCHLMLVDLRPQGLTGKAAEESLERAGLTCNKNAIPFDTEKPFITSGIRLGTPAGTTRGFGVAEFATIGNMVADVLDGLAKNGENNSALEHKVRFSVEELCTRFPIMHK